MQKDCNKNVGVYIFVAVLCCVWSEFVSGLFILGIDLRGKSWYSDLIYMYIGDRDEYHKFY